MSRRSRHACATASLPSRRLPQTRRRPSPVASTRCCRIMPRSPNASRRSRPTTSKPSGRSLPRRVTETPPTTRPVVTSPSWPPGWRRSPAAKQTEALAAHLDALSSDHAIVARRVEGAMSAHDDEVRDLRSWSEQLQSDQDEGRRHIETLAARVEELGRLGRASVEEVTALEERLSRTWAARQPSADDVHALADRLERLADEQARAVQRLDDVVTGQNYAVRAVDAARQLVASGHEDALRRIDALKDRLERLEAALRR